MERVTLGDFPQTIRIRGDDRQRNPVLLFIHGGPGLPEMPVAHRNAELERVFTVVHWDQRGAGKSFSFHTPNMRAEQFVNDTLELSRELRRRFDGRKIFLAGYSWGSLVAARYHWEGTHKGTFLGIPPTGRRIVVRGMDFYRFADGRIVEHWDNVDEFGMLSQLGDLG